MTDEDRQRVYLPTLQADAGGNSLLERYVENALTYGPVYQLVVHDTPSWRQVAASNPILEPVIRRIPDDEVRSFEHIAERFMAPLVDNLDPIQEMNGSKVGSIEVYRQMRNVLVALQIGAKYRSAIAVDPTFVERSFGAIENMRRQPEFPDHGEIMARLGALEAVLRAYETVDVAGITYVPKGLSLDEKLALLDDAMFDALSRSKWSLALQDSPLATKRARVFERTQAALDKFPAKATMALDTFLLITGAGGNAYVGAAALIAEYIKSVRLDTFAPARVSDFPLTWTKTEGVARSSSYGWEVSFVLER